MKICPICKRELSDDKFFKQKNSRDGLYYRCKDCCKVERKEYYNKHKDKWLNPESLKKSATNRRLARKELRKEVLSHYSNDEMICDCCGEDYIEFLTIDHIDGGGNIHRKILGKGNADRGSSKLYRWLKDNNYPDGFRVLCSNCNSSYANYGYCPHKANK